MQRDNDRAKRKKEEVRDEEELNTFLYDDGSVYDGRVSRREIPPEIPKAFSGLSINLAASITTTTATTTAINTTTTFTALPRSQQSQDLPTTVPFQHGKGVFMDVGGAVYDGNWSDGAMNGECVLRFPSGATYEGQMCANEFSGMGAYTWPDGSRYEGEWENNQMHGLGTYVDAHGKRWVGKFYQGNGIGLLAEIKL